MMKVWGHVCWVWEQTGKDWSQDGGGKEEEQGFRKDWEETKGKRQEQGFRKDWEETKEKANKDSE